MTDRGFTDKIKGKAKETAGDITNNQELKAKGLVDQAKGKIKEVSEDVKDTVEEVKEKIEDKLEKDK